MMPNRHATAPPWFEIPLDVKGRDAATFRREYPTGWVGPLGPGDPRLQAGGDHARRGSIPPYVPMAKLSPASTWMVPQ